MDPLIVSHFSLLVDLSPEGRARYFQENDVSPELQFELKALLGHDSCGDGGLHDLVQEAVDVSFRADEELPEGRYCGPYRLLRLIGRGGMGLVYLAERADGELRQRVAVKLLKAGLESDDARYRFLQERQILADLSHPNIARLLDAGHSVDEQPYLAMEYIDGEPIDQYAGTLSIRQRVELSAILCDAVSYAHQKLVVHRDLKPNNIMVDRAGTPKLLDFGIAKLIDVAGDTTVTVERRLTPSYASPEQARGRTSGTASDIYSLGAVIYKLLTGREPLEIGGGMTPAEMEAAICEKNPPKPSQWNNKIDRDLDAIVLKAMRKESGERYATADRLAEDLRAWLRGLPVRARQGGWWYVARRNLRRYWVPVTAGVVAIAGLTAGLLTALHERDFAQRRFAEVKQLANEMLKVETDIAELPGATTARERIVKTSLAYLERLSKDAGNDVELESEIAVAYRTIANIQGGFRRTNLGRPDDARASLRKAESFFREALRSRPDDVKALRDLMDTIDLRARIDYGQQRTQDAEAEIDELRELAIRYERATPETTSKWGHLSTIYDDLALVSRRAYKLDQAMDFARKSVDYEKKLVSVENSPEDRGNLAISLSSYGRILRSAGDLDGALPVLKEGSAILEDLARNRTNDFLMPLNLGADCSDRGDLLGEEDRILSFGRYDEGVAWYERALKYEREAVRLDPHENQARANTAQTAQNLGNVVRHTDSARALRAYDESIALLRGMPEKMPSRDIPLSIALSESTFPLLRLHREAEARKRLGQAKQIAGTYKDLAPESPNTPAEPISRAEADWAMASGRPAQAAEIHLQWLGEVKFGRKTVQKSLRDALLVARRYLLLSRAYQMSGQPGPEADALAKRREILEFWKNKPTSKKFVEEVLAEK